MPRWLTPLALPGLAARSRLSNLRIYQPPAIAFSIALKKFGNVTLFPLSSYHIPFVKPNC
jgi:hypothetical protein